MCSKSNCDNVPHKLLLLALFCGHLVYSYPDVHHRIVIKNKYRRPTQNYKEQPVEYYRNKVKKPLVYDSAEDNSSEYASYPRENIHYSNRNENVRNKTKKAQKPFNYSTIDLTTPFSSELSVPLYESTFTDYLPQSNRSLDLDAKASNYHLQLNNLLNRLMEKHQQELNESKIEGLDQTVKDYQVREEQEAIKPFKPDFFNFSGPSSNNNWSPHYGRVMRPNYNFIGARSFN